MQQSDSVPERALQYEVTGRTVEHGADCTIFGEYAGTGTGGLLASCRLFER